MNIFVFIFYRYFNRVDICKVRPDWHEARVNGKLPSNCRDALKAVKVTVAYTTEVDIGVFQESRRLGTIFIFKHRTALAEEKCNKVYIF